MKLTGSQRIAAPKAKVWEALNDPETLKRAIPGCEDLEREGDDRFRATVAVKIGPIGARFNGSVTLGDLDPPNGYTITGQGQGGPAGFAKGAAKVRLEEDGGATTLHYDADAQVGGRIAQLGGPIIEATAKRLLSQFFERFSEIVAPTPGGAKAAGVAPASSASPTRAGEKASVSAPSGPTRPAVWIASLVAAIIAGAIVGNAAEALDADGWVMVALGLAMFAAGTLGYAFGRGGRGG